MSVSAAQQQQFVNTYLPYAQEAAQELGADNSATVTAILTQWADESAWGTSHVAANDNNLAGITQGGGYAHYDSVDSFVQGYVQTMNLGYYSSVVSDMKNGSSVSAILTDLGISPWDAGHYTDPSSGTPGSDLLSIAPEIANLLGEAGLINIGGSSGSQSGGGASVGDANYATAASGQINFYNCLQSGQNFSLLSPSTWGDVLANCTHDALVFIFTNALFLLLLLGGVYLLFRPQIDAAASKYASQAQQAAETAAMAG